MKMVVFGPMYATGSTLSASGDRHTRPVASGCHTVQRAGKSRQELWLVVDYATVHISLSDGSDVSDAFYELGPEDRGRAFMDLSLDDKRRAEKLLLAVGARADGRSVRERCARFADDLWRQL